MGASTSSEENSLAVAFIYHAKTCQRQDSNADSNNGFKTQTLLNILAINWKKTQHIKVKSNDYDTHLNSERQGVQSFTIYKIFT